MLKGVIRYVRYLGDGHDQLQCLTCYSFLPGVIDKYSSPLWNSGPLCFCPYCGTPITKYIPEKQKERYWEGMTSHPSRTKEWVIQERCTWFGEGEWTDEYRFAVRAITGDAKRIKNRLEEMRCYHNDDHFEQRVFIRPILKERTTAIRLEELTK